MARNFGAANAASEDIHNREEKMEGAQWQKKIERNGWNGKDDKGRIQELAEATEDGEMYLALWLSVEYGKRINGKVTVLGSKKSVCPLKCQTRNFHMPIHRPKRRVH